jgi:hypothetical protein
MEVMDAVESTLGPKVYRNNYVVHYVVAAPFFARGLRLGRRGKISILHLRAALQPKKRPKRKSSKLLKTQCARMAKLADARDLKSRVLNGT